MTPPEIERVAKGLSEGQRKALLFLPSWGFPAGHNQWPDVEYVDASNPDETVCAGEDMDALLRRGLADSGERDAEGGIHLIDDDRECEARWPVDVTSLGLAVRRYLQENAQ